MDRRAFVYAGSSSLAAVVAGCSKMVVQGPAPGGTGAVSEAGASGGPMPGPEQVAANKALLEGMLKRLSAGDVDGFVQGLAPDYVRHCQAMPPALQEIRGREAMRAWLLSNQATFPDYHEEPELLVGEGRYVAWRSVGTGTMKGAMGPFPPSGRVMRIVIMGMHRFEHGRVAETWTSWDNVAALTQLGLMPGGTPA